MQMVCNRLDQTVINSGIKSEMAGVIWVFSYGFTEKMNRIDQNRKKILVSPVSGTMFLTSSAFGMCVFLYIRFHCMQDISINSKVFHVGGRATCGEAL